MVASDDTSLTKRQRRTFIAILSFTAAISIQSLLSSKPWEYYDDATFREDEALVQEMVESAEADNLLKSLDMTDFDASVLAIPEKEWFLHRHLAEVLPAHERFLAAPKDNTENGAAGTGDYKGNGPCCGLCNAYENAGCRKFDLFLIFSY